MASILAALAGSWVNGVTSPSIAGSPFGSISRFNSRYRSASAAAWVTWRAMSLSSSAARLAGAASMAYPTRWRPPAAIGASRLVCTHFATAGAYPKMYRSAHGEC